MMRKYNVGPYMSLLSLQTINEDEWQFYKHYSDLQSYQNSPVPLESFVKVFVEEMRLRTASPDIRMDFKKLEECPSATFLYSDDDSLRKPSSIGNNWFRRHCCNNHPCAGWGWLRLVAWNRQRSPRLSSWWDGIRCCPINDDDETRNTQRLHVRNKVYERVRTCWNLGSDQWIRYGSITFYSVDWFRLCDVYLVFVSGISDDDECSQAER